MVVYDFESMKKAAKQDDPEKQYELGKEGRVLQDCAKAVWKFLRPPVFLRIMTYE